MADLHEVRRPPRAADRQHTIAPRRRGRRRWATEFWWFTNPPNPLFGIPLRRFAHRIEEGLYVMWKQGASGAINLQVRDDPTDPAQPGGTEGAGPRRHGCRWKPERVSPRR